MKRIKNYKSFIKINESWSPEETLRELSLPLTDAGLYVTISVTDGRFPGKRGLYIVISDTDKVFCRNYPRDDMDWLNNKPIIKDFLKELDDFGAVRDIDYLLFGGGLTVTLFFNKAGMKSIKL